MPLSRSAFVASARVANSTNANCPPLPATRASSTAPHTENVALKCSTPMPAARFLTITDVAASVGVGAGAGVGVASGDPPARVKDSAPGFGPAKNTGKGDPAMGRWSTTTPTL